MGGRRAVFVIAVASLIAGLLLTGIAWAKATKTPVAVTKEVWPSAQPPARQWIDEDGIWHIRGSVADVVIQGDLDGLGIAVVNLNLDLSTGNGDEAGYATMNLDWGDLSGTFEGHFSVAYTGFVGVGHGTYHGTGGFAGMKLKEQFTVTLSEGPPYHVTSEGAILNPHGE
jgi:hypothetical protein